MANVEAARVALDRIEGFLRSRYHYPHPIFAHIAAAQEHLAEDAPSKKAAPTPASASAPVAATTEGPVGTSGAGTSAAAAPKAPKERQKRGNKA